MPTFFITGTYDEIRPAHVRDMHKRVTGSEFREYRNSAHLPFEEEPEAFMTDYRGLSGPGRASSQHSAQDFGAFAPTPAPSMAWGKPSLRAGRFSLDEDRLCGLPWFTSRAR